MERKLYSLEAINNNDKTDRVVIKIKSPEGKYETKTHLSNIDKYITTYFDNKEQLINYLQTKGIISSKYDDIKITYKYNGIRTMELEFKGNDILNSISKNSKTRIDMTTNKREFYIVYNKFMELCRSNTFFDVIRRSNQLPEHLISRANQFNKFINEDDNESKQEFIEIKESIRNMLENYKTFRTIVIYVESYLNNVDVIDQTTLPNINDIQIKGQMTLDDIKSQVESDEIEYDREEKEEFLSEEEIESQYPKRDR